MSIEAKRMEILTDLQSGKINSEQAGKLLAALDGEGKVKGGPTPLTPKVSESGKGCLCVYGLQVRPVTLYAPQWERLLTDGLDEATAKAVMEQHTVLKYIAKTDKEHPGKLSRKKASDSAAE